jgi:sulfur relay protein TusB/DsrH
MSTLFIAIRSPNSGSQFETIFSLAQQGDGVIVAQDAVLSVKTNLGDLDSASKRGVTIFALKADLEARSISIPQFIHSIDYVRFVELLAEYARTFS